MTNKERQELVENLRDRVADIKWDVQKVLDGDLEPFIQAYLLSSSINRSKEDFNNNKH